MAWLRLDADYMEDPKVWDAGWETAALWPAVLALLKANDGVLDDQLFSARYLSRKMDCPREVASAAVEGIKRTGLLVCGVVSWKVHKGNVASREGWYSPRWAEHGNAPNSWEVGLIDGRDSCPKVSDTLPNLAEGSDTLPKVSHTLRNDSRARCGSVGLSVGGSEEEAREAQGSLLPEIAGESAPAVEAPPPKPSEADEVWSAWREQNPSARAKPTKGQRDTIKARLKDYSVEELSAYFRWVRESSHQRAAFLREGSHDGFTSMMRPSNVDERMPWVAEWSGGGAQGRSLKASDFRWLEDAVMAKISREGLRESDVTVSLLQAHPKIGEVPKAMQEEIIRLCRIQMGWAA